MNRWFEALAGLTLVAAWLMVAWTTDAGMRDDDLADAAARAAAQRVVVDKDAPPSPTKGARS